MINCQIDTMYAGDSPTFLITVTDQDGNPYPLTGHTIYMTAKRQKSDPDGSAIFQLSSTAGEITVGVPTNTAEAVPPSADTNGLTANVSAYIGVRVITPGGRPFTVFEGTLPIVIPTTRTNTP